MEVITVKPDPMLQIREAHDALEYALMHPGELGRHISKREMQRLEWALQEIKKVLK